MTPKQMIKMIQHISGQVNVTGNIVEFVYGDVSLALVYDEPADRMRLIVPIAKAEELTPELMMRALDANFHTALDARYAVGKGLIWAAFMHPLKDLTETLFLSAIDQVAQARQTFGSTFSSTELIFPD